ncbi:MAG: hypothetical protein ACRDL4_04920 [Thermoleophilaceae bacterium]
MDALEERLSAAAERGVQLVDLGSAGRSPGLLVDALRDGRVLSDRDGLWTRLARDEPALRRAAARQDRERLDRALVPLEAGV